MRIKALKIFHCAFGMAPCPVMHLCMHYTYSITYVLYIHCICFMFSACVHGAAFIAY